jgi:hypothetical protein
LYFLDERKWDLNYQEFREGFLNCDPNLKSKDGNKIIPFRASNTSSGNIHYLGRCGIALMRGLKNF